MRQSQKESFSARRLYSLNSHMIYVLNFSKVLERTLNVLLVCRSAPEKTVFFAFAPRCDRFVGLTCASRSLG